MMAERLADPDLEEPIRRSCCNESGLAVGKNHPLTDGFKASAIDLGCGIHLVADRHGGFGVVFGQKAH